VNSTGYRLKHCIIWIRAGLSSTYFSKVLPKTLTNPLPSKKKEASQNQLTPLNSSGAEEGTRSKVALGPKPVGAQACLDNPFVLFSQKIKRTLLIAFQP
jgi:hypothetical protein